MRFNCSTRYTRHVLAGAVLTCAALALALPVRTAFAAQPSPAVQQLLDRAQIENLLTQYYGGLGGDSKHDFGSFYTADGVLDVNGIVARGPKAIDALYKKIGAGAPALHGAYNMLLTNEKIVVHGDTATAQDIWTGINSPTPESKPRFIEQGHEHDQLVKRNGRWYFSHRVITSDAGLTPMFEKTYKKR